MSAQESLCLKMEAIFKDTKGDRNGMALALGCPPTILTLPKNCEIARKKNPGEGKNISGARMDYSAILVVSHLALLVFSHQKWSLERV